MEGQVVVKKALMFDAEALTGISKKHLIAMYAAAIQDQVARQDMIQILGRGK